MANLIIAGLVMTDATLEQHNAGNDHGQRRKPLRRQMFGEQDMADVAAYYSAPAVQAAAK